MNLKIMSAYRLLYSSQMSIFKSISLGLAFGAVCASPAWALPGLQLGANPSIYRSGDETVQATANPFTLYALGDSTGPHWDLSSTYFLSLAIVKHDGSPMTIADKTFGTFTISGAGVSGGTRTYAFSDLVFGNPPFEASLDKDPGDLSSHSIFPTYFAEVGFKFTTSKTTTPYNVQDTPNGFTPATTGSMFYQDFNVNITGLADGYDLHFDLYDEVVKSGGDIDVDDFAPFSHDAVSGPHTNVPDASSSVVLLGVALLGLGGFRYRFGFASK
jgi:hypothetical protein